MENLICSLKSISCFIANCIVLIFFKQFLGYIILLFFCFHKDVINKFSLFLLLKIELNHILPQSPRLEDYRKQLSFLTCYLFASFFCFHSYAAICLDVSNSVTILKHRIISCIFHAEYK